MSMAVVQVGPMRVPMRHGRVGMPMRVPGRALQAGMIVVVMRIVVEMLVLMLDRLVGMRMSVPV